MRGSSALPGHCGRADPAEDRRETAYGLGQVPQLGAVESLRPVTQRQLGLGVHIDDDAVGADADGPTRQRYRSEEHTAELQSLMRLSYAVFCLTNKKNTNNKS